MRTLLVVQQGAEAGRSYALDPQKQPLLSMGRSSQCDVVVRDQNASRHHCDLRWNGRSWEVVDRASTNGTRVNGVPIHDPVAMYRGDTIGIGETTLVLREQHELQPQDMQPQVAKFAGPPTEAALPRRPAPLQPVPVHAPPWEVYGDQGEAAAQQAHTGAQVAFWFVEVLVGAAVACLAAGAFLPWFRVTGSLSSELESLIRGIADIVSSFIGDNLLSVTQDISALSGLGMLTLGLAVVGGIMLVVDIFLRRKWVVAALVYLLTSAGAIVAIAADLKRYYDLYEQAQSLSLLFGVKLADVVEAFGKFIDVKVTLLPGLYLTLIGLGLLLVGGFARLVVALLARDR